MMIEPIARRTVADEVASRLRARILAGSLPEGAALRQDAIAGELGVSRIPVREALAQLEAEGLVRLEPHRGAFVTELSMDDVSELFELRVAIEPLILRQAIPRMQPADLDGAQVAADAFQAALAKGDRDRWGELNWHFHEALYRPAERPRMLRLLHELNNSTARCVRLHLGISGAVQRAGADHLELIRHCRSGRVAAAVELLTRHIEAAGQELLEWLADRQRPKAQRCA
jgi:DNA-binding GntR family transcriptional regulator